MSVPKNAPVFQKYCPQCWRLLAKRLCLLRVLGLGVFHSRLGNKVVAYDCNDECKGEEPSPQSSPKRKKRPYTDEEIDSMSKEQMCGALRQVTKEEGEAQIPDITLKRGITVWDRKCCVS
jgi:hypothetical protein